MPRAFLIKKKRHHGLQSVSAIKKRKSDFSLNVTLLEVELNARKEQSYDSGSESGLSSISSGQRPSPNPSPNPPLVPATAAPSSISRPTAWLQGDIYGRPSVLEPLNLNASTAANALPWMKPFLAPYLPFNYPYHPSYPSTLHSEAAYPHHFQAPYPTSQRVIHPHQGSSVPKGALYPSRSEPPSPSCPCPLSPYTPPRDGSPPSSSPCKDPEPIKSSKQNLYFTHSEPLKSHDNPSVESSDSNASTSAINMTVNWRSANYWSESDKSGQEDDQLVSKEEQSNAVQTSLNTIAPRRRTLDGGPRYQCPDCNKSYSTYSGLSKHQQFHCSTTNKKSFSCKYCDKVYVSLGSLKMHIRCHSLPCMCPMCPKRFSRPWLLQGHIRTHTGEKPFVCPNCNRAFADRSNLRAHVQTHSDVKKYSCKACAKTFSRMSLLVKHEDGGACTHNTTTSLTNLNQERL